jgi:hypothetical protein
MLNADPGHGTKLGNSSEETRVSQGCLGDTCYCPYVRIEFAEQDLDPSDDCAHMWLTSLHDSTLCCGMHRWGTSCIALSIRVMPPTVRDSLGR